MTDNVPGFIDPNDISTFDADKLETFIDTLRTRRLTAAKEYELKQIQAARTQSDKLKLQIHKQSEMWNKEIAQCDRVLDKLDARIMRLRTLMLELGDLEEFGGAI